ncbi:hypothetical protein E1200_12005, partial [Actinomadura sp. GC306]
MCRRAGTCTRWAPAWGSGRAGSSVDRRGARNLTREYAGAGTAGHPCVHFVHGEAETKGARVRRPAWTIPGRWSVARQLLVLQAAIVGLLVAAGATIAYLDAGRSADDAAAQTVTAVAKSIADADNVRVAVATSDPSRLLQPFAERVRRDTGVDFVTIMSPAGLRYT